MSSSIPIATSARSSLEEMLDSIKRRDEQLMDLPPPLPARPASRGRLPSSRRSLPLNLKMSDNASELLLENVDTRDDDRGSNQESHTAFKNCIFGNKRMVKLGQPVESPYINMPKLERCDERPESVDDSVSSSALSSMAGPIDDDLKWHDTIDCVLKKKLRVWCHLPEAEWELGKIQSFSGVDADLLLCDGKVLTLPLENILPANPDILDCVNDLLQLSYLNEPSVLHNLKCRFIHDLIYTKAGPVLVSINPFKKVPVYGNELIEAYRQKIIDTPHVYAVADAAFSNMMRDGTNQSIIIR